MGLLSGASPPGAELEESSKNMKKLDAMTLIKEGGSLNLEDGDSGEIGPPFFPLPLGAVA